MENENNDYEKKYWEEDYSGNMPCDTYGMCPGTSCPNYFKCQGK